MRFFWFVLLKVVEIGVIVFVPHYLGKFVHHWTEAFCYKTNTGEIEHTAHWSIGLATLLSFAVIIMFVFVGIKCFVINWELAGEIRSRF